MESRFGAPTSPHPHLDSVTRRHSHSVLRVTFSVSQQPGGGQDTRYQSRSLWNIVCLQHVLQKHCQSRSSALSCHPKLVRNTQSSVNSSSIYQPPERKPSKFSHYSQFSLRTPTTIPYLRYGHPRFPWRSVCAL